MLLFIIQFLFGLFNKIILLFTAVKANTQKLKIFQQLKKFNCTMLKMFSRARGFKKSMADELNHTYSMFKQKKVTVHSIINRSEFDQTVT